jgi:hypothetical protein
MQYIKNSNEQSYYYNLSISILNNALYKWFSNPMNKDQKPFISIRIFKKVRKDELFDLRRQWAQERLAKDLIDQGIDIESIIKRESEMKDRERELKMKERMLKLKEKRERRKLKLKKQNPYISEVEMTVEKVKIIKTKYPNEIKQSYDGSIVYSPVKLKTQESVVESEKMVIKTNLDDVDIHVEEIQDDPIIIKRWFDKCDYQRELAWVPFANAWGDIKIINDIKALPNMKEFYDDDLLTHYEIEKLMSDVNNDFKAPNSICLPIKSNHLDGRLLMTRRNDDGIIVEIGYFHENFLNNAQYKMININDVRLLI